MIKPLKHSAGHAPRGSLRTDGPDRAQTEPRLDDRDAPRPDARTTERTRSQAPSPPPPLRRPAGARPEPDAPGRSRHSSGHEVDDEIEHVYNQLKSELALLEVHRAQRRPRRQTTADQAPSPRSPLREPPLRNAPMRGSPVRREHAHDDPHYAEHDGYDFAPPPYDADEGHWQDHRSEPGWSSWLVRRVAFPVAFAAVTLLFAGGLAVLLLGPPTDSPLADSPLADGPLADISDDVPTRADSGVTVAPAPAKPKITVLEKRDADPEADGTPPSDFSDTDAPPPAAPVLPGNSAPPAPLPATRTADIAPATSTIRFAPTGSIQDSQSGTIPPEVSALVPSQRSVPSQSNQPQPLAFAPVAAPLLVEEVAPPAPIAPDPVAEASRIDPLADEPSTSTARVTTFVNMRAGPDNEQPVVTVVPENGEIEIISCKIWCQVDYQGQRGWIFKDFVNRSGNG